MGQGYQNKSDAHTWSDFKSGISEAFSYIYHTHYRRLYTYGYTLRPDKEMVQDALQELFLDLWHGRERLAAVQSIQVYLLVSFRRKLLVKANQQKKYCQVGQEQEDNLRTNSFEADWIALQDENSQHQRLHVEVDKLPKRQREAIFLRYYQELSYQQITEVMDLQYQTVRDLIYKALKTLRQHLKLLFLLAILVGG